MVPVTACVLVPEPACERGDVSKGVEQGVGLVPVHGLLPHRSGMSVLWKSWVLEVVSVTETLRKRERTAGPRGYVNYIYLICTA